MALTVSVAFLSGRTVTVAVEPTATVNELRKKVLATVPTVDALVLALNSQLLQPGALS